MSLRCALGVILFGRPLLGRVIVCLTRCERCMPMPGCMHGSCQQPWQCSCEPGWGGRFCDKDLSVCLEQRPCENGATCVMEDSGEYTCLCADSFHGRNCQLKAGPCHQRRSPCKNGGLCEDADGFAAELTCRCLAGFTGLHCETDLDDCLMKPCANGATCLDGVNHFSCLCPAGFTGRFCTINEDDCASQPCMNGGRCLDRAGGFYCICKPGFTGTICEMALRKHEARESVWTTLGWQGGGGGVIHHVTTQGKNQRIISNSSHHSNRLFKVTVSERSTGGLSEVQFIVLLVLAGLTLGMVVLTTALVMQSHCRDCRHAPCWSLSQRGRNRVKRALHDDCQLSFLNTAEPEKKKLNTDVV
uniref:EGF-like domain-containing protein n=1 Tax=Monopterus albus TaxID=43700 RepID=A0A3Q3J494_MONAL